MPTSAYVPFNYAQPNQGQTGASAIDSTRANLQTLQHALVMGGMPGWSCASSAPYDAPPQVVYTNLALAAEKIKLVFTRTSGIITKVRFYYSSDTGVSYVLITRLLITYDGSNNFVSSTYDNVDA